MNHTEKRLFLIRALLDEQPDYQQIAIPAYEEDQKQLLRSLFNVRIPSAISEEFLKVQDEYLREAIAEKGITDLSDLSPVSENLYLWQGDITTLRCDAIVNAANSGMTGCYQPCHNCIDNCIHTYAGIQLRNYCADLMRKQGRPDRQRSRPLSTCPAAMCCTPSAPLFRENSQWNTRSCWLPVTALVWNWLWQTTSRLWLSAAFPPVFSVSHKNGQRRLPWKRCKTIKISR